MGSIAHIPSFACYAFSKSKPFFGSESTKERLGLCQKKARILFHSQFKPNSVVEGVQSSRTFYGTRMVGRLTDMCIFCFPQGFVFAVLLYVLSHESCTIWLYSCHHHYSFQISVYLRQHPKQNPIIQLISTINSQSITLTRFPYPPAHRFPSSSCSFHTSHTLTLEFTTVAEERCLPAVNRLGDSAVPLNGRKKQKAIVFLVFLRFLFKDGILR